MKISVILIALNEQEFIKPCIRAIYPFVDRIRIQTNYDRSWKGELVEPDQTVKRIIDVPDPAGKISLHLFRVPDEAIARNWLMRSDGYRLNHRHNSTTSRREDIQNFCSTPDYFWIVDADEIYDPDTVPRILDYLQSKRPRILKIRGITYFKSWNYRIVPSDGFFQPGFIRQGVLFRENRNLLYPPWFRFFMNKYWRINLEPSQGVVYLPEEVAVFHHGAYVGDDLRMYKKIFFHVHLDSKRAEWFEKVWKRWTPAARAFHPLYPEEFQGVEHVPTCELPGIIKDEEWPEGYLEREQET